MSRETILNGLKAKQGKGLRDVDTEKPAVLEVAEESAELSDKPAESALSLKDPDGRIKIDLVKLEELAFGFRTNIVRYPDEGHEWCGRLPRMLPTPQAWVDGMLHEAGFEQVEMIAAPGHRGFVGRLRAWLGKSYNARGVDRTLSTRIVRRIFGLDPRDGRDIFIARRR